MRIKCVFCKFYQITVYEKKTHLNILIVMWIKEYSNTKTLVGKNDVFGNLAGSLVLEKERTNTTQFPHRHREGKH